MGNTVSSNNNSNKFDKIPPGPGSSGSDYARPPYQIIKPNTSGSQNTPSSSDFGGIR